MNLIKMTSAQVAARNAKKEEEIKVYEQTRYQEMFGTVPTDEQRNDWFRCNPKFGPQMKHGEEK